MKGLGINLKNDFEFILNILFIPVNSVFKGSVVLCPLPGNCSPISAKGEEKDSPS